MDTVSRVERMDWRSVSTSYAVAKERVGNMNTAPYIKIMQASQDADRRTTIRYIDVHYTRSTI